MQLHMTISDPSVTLRKRDSALMYHAKDDILVTFRPWCVSCSFPYHEALSRSIKMFFCVIAHHRVIVFCTYGFPCVTLGPQEWTDILSSTVKLTTRRV